MDDVRLADGGVVPVTRTDMVYEAVRAVTERTFYKSMKVVPR